MKVWKLVTEDWDQGQEQGRTPGEGIAFGVLGTGFLLERTHRSDSGMKGPLEEARILMFS